MVGPDIAEHEGPDADENVDEHFHRGGGAEDPARLVVHALARRLRQNQGFGNAAAGNRRTARFCWRVRFRRPQPSAPSTENSVAGMAGAIPPTPRRRRTAKGPDT